MIGLSRWQDSQFMIEQSPLDCLIVNSTPQTLSRAPPATSHRLSRSLLPLADDSPMTPRGPGVVLSDSIDYCFPSVKAIKGKIPTPQTG